MWGTSAARLSVGETLGEGGMARVRSAVQEALGRRVAVKLLSAETRTEHDELTLLARSVVSPHRSSIPTLCRSTDVLVDEAEGPLVVLKQVEGTTWFDLIDDNGARAA